MNDNNLTLVAHVSRAKIMISLKWARESVHYKLQWALCELERWLPAARCPLPDARPI